MIIDRIWFSRVVNLGWVWFGYFHHRVSFLFLSNLGLRNNHFSYWLLLLSIKVVIALWKDRLVLRLFDALVDLIMKQLFLYFFKVQHSFLCLIKLWWFPTLAKVPSSEVKALAWVVIMLLAWRIQASHSQEILVLRECGVFVSRMTESDWGFVLFRESLSS